MKQLTLCLLLIITLQTQAQNTEAEKNWHTYMTPGSMQQVLARSNGEWTADMTFWMTPDAPPEKMTAAMTNRMILGGRYQESTHTGNMMGMPFEGIGTTGYDNLRKVFVSTWIDNMGTGIIYMEGTWDEATKTITMKGKQTDPQTGKQTDIRQVLKIVDDRTQVLEMYYPHNGKEFKGMEITYKRK